MSRKTDPSRRPAAPRASALLLAVVASLAAATVAARSSDRNQPMDIDAGRQVGTFSGDSVNTLSGGVHITQGSLDITSDTARITLANSEPTRAVFSGGPVALKQTLDDGTPMNARANGVDYNLKTGSVDSGGEGSGRVKMRILPRNARATPAADDKDGN